MTRRFIDRKNTTEDNTDDFFGEASTVGLRPGEWPKYMETNLGNGCSLYLFRMHSDRCIYHQNYGCITLTIWND